MKRTFLPGSFPRKGYPEQKSELINNLISQAKWHPYFARLTTLIVLRIYRM